MKTASQCISESQRQQVNQAVQQAEQQTCAEIVPVVATASGRYDRPEDVAGLWLAVIALVVVGSLLPQPPEAGSWAGGSGGYNLAILAAVVVAGFVLGALLAARIAWLRRLFTSRREMADEVARRAQEAFVAREVFRTQGATGLVIYVSLFERLARVQADRAVTDALGPEALDALAADLAGRLHEGDLGSALAETIRQAGEKLAGPLPRQADDIDELPNELVVLD